MKLNIMFVSRTLPTSKWLYFSMFVVSMRLSRCDSLVDFVSGILAPCLDSSKGSELLRWSYSL